MELRAGVILLSNIHAIIAILSPSCSWKYFIKYIQYDTDALIKLTAKQLWLIMHNKLELNALVILQCKIYISDSCLTWSSVLTVLVNLSSH